MTKKMSTSYRYLNQKEIDRTVMQILDVLLDESVPFSGTHRKIQWDKGWGQNLKEGTVMPKYFGKHLVQRKNGRFIMAKYKGFEARQLHDLVFSLAKKYFTNLQNVYEFGCGTGHNLTYVQMATKAKVHGLDWATSSQVLLKKQGIDSYNFDFFKPSSLKLKEDAGVLTVAALEQTGTDYKKFVSYLLKNKPNVVVHIEPIPEFLNPSNLLDYLSIKYMEKRKYLSGYANYLAELERKGKIKILEARRSGIGSKFIDGYSILVWKPV